MLLTEPILVLMQTGRYQIITPEESEHPLIKTILYLDGDVVNFTNLMTVENQRELIRSHLNKAKKEVDAISKQMKRLEWGVSIVLVVSSWLFYFLNTIDLQTQAITSALFGILVIYFRKFFRKIVSKTFTRRLLKRFVANVD